MLLHVYLPSVLARVTLGLPSYGPHLPGALDQGDDRAGDLAHTPHGHPIAGLLLLLQWCHEAAHLSSSLVLEGF